MGCDIHLYVEKKVDGKWVNADTWTEDEYEPDRMQLAYKTRFYTGRNYDLFAMFANVRNGSGFAGIKTGDGFVPIAMPRGLPDDCSAEVASESAEWGVDGHSHSYLTVAELMAYDWTQTTRKVGWVDPYGWARWKDYGKPEEWCGSVGGGNVRHLPEAEFAAAWDRLKTKLEYPYQRQPSSHIRPLSGHDNTDVAAFIREIGGGSPYCEVEWQIAYYQSAKEFLGETLPRLWALGDYDKVRIVFWFDN